MKILVAYDGSEFADAALADLKNAGFGTDAEVLVMSLADVFLPPPIDETVDGTSPTYLTEGMRAALARAQHELDAAKALAKRAAERLSSAFPSWVVNYDAQADSPAWAILRMADDSKSDLIVMGARGHSVFGGRLILGSISQRVLYEARCSVRIARRAREVDGPVRILIGLDHSEDSNAAVDAVCNRSWPTGSEVALLSVVDTVMAVAGDAGQPATVKWIEVGDEKNWDQVRELFEPEAQKLRAAGLHVDILVRRGSPADEILEEAQSWGADCIFVGAKGARGIDRLLLGSVSSSVAARAHCSVEVVRVAKTS